MRPWTLVQGEALLMGRRFIGVEREAAAEEESCSVADLL
jgi:hypothetical protein